MLWNLERTLVDIGRVARVAYAEAFERVTGEPLVYLAPTVAATDSELFFAFMARNGIESDDDKFLPLFLDALAECFAQRRKEIAVSGDLLPGALEALRGIAQLDDTVQTVVTGAIKPNALVLASVFGLDEYLDMSIGGYGSENYPKASLIQFTRMRAEQACQRPFPDTATVYISHSVRDVEAARIGRVTPVAVVSGTDTTARLRQAGAQHVLADLSDPAAVRDTVVAATG